MDLHLHNRGQSTLLSRQAYRTAPSACNRLIGSDTRVTGAGWTSGVASYARTLHAVQRSIVPNRFLLGAVASDRSPLRAALIPGMRNTRWAAGEEDGPRLLGIDIFRRAFHHFNIYRQPLRLRVPGPPGVMHWTYPVPLLLAGWSNLYTVHDAIPITHPALTPINGRRHARLLTALLRHGARFVTVTDAAEVEISAATGCSSALLRNCGQAADLSQFAPGARVPEGLIPRGYLLVCGSVEPRKNIERLLAAYRQSGTALPLVIAGPDGWQLASFAEALRRPGVRRIGEVDRPTILSLIANARALLMPSLAEGFGLPALEAMALGTPVVVSRGGALGEVTRDAALAVDPLSVDDIARAIDEIVSDDALAGRLVAAGRRRAEQYSTARFAARLAALYEEVAPIGRSAYRR